MATRKKTKVKAKLKVKRKRASPKKPAARKKTIKKIAKKTSKKAVRRVPSKKKPRPSVRPSAKPEPQLTPSAPGFARGERIGVVTHYFSHLSVAVIKLERGRLHVGDMIHFKGHTSDFGQRIDSLQVNHVALATVGPNDDFGLKVISHAREGDVVYKV